MHPPELPDSDSPSSPSADGPDGTIDRGSDLPTLISAAYALRSRGRYALHPVETALLHFRAEAEIHGEEGEGHHRFAEAEGHYRAGAQGLRLSEIPKLAEKIPELSRLGAVDQAGRKALRRWVETQGSLIDEGGFFERWRAQGSLGGAEHQVYHDEACGRWFKRLYFGVNLGTLGDYLARMRLHAVLFPETAYRLEGFTINPKSKALAPVVSQPHVEVDLTKPLVSREETDDLMAAMGFAPVQLKYDGIQDDEYFAYLHPGTGVLAHDLHDENVVRLAGTDELVVIDPYLSLARRGSWAALKLAEIGYPPPPDDESLEVSL
jgi:hypothetical protein